MIRFLFDDGASFSVVGLSALNEEQKAKINPGEDDIIVILENETFRAIGKIQVRIWEENYFSDVIVFVLDDSVQN